MSSKGKDMWDAWDDFVGDGAEVQEAGSVVVAGKAATSRRAAKTAPPKKRPAPVVEQIEEDDDDDEEEEDDDDDDAIAEAVAESVSKQHRRAARADEEDEDDDEDDEEEDDDPPPPPKSKAKPKRPPAKKPKLAATPTPPKAKAKRMPKPLDMEVEPVSQTKKKQRKQKTGKKAAAAAAASPRVEDEDSAAEKPDKSKITSAQALAWVVRKLSERVEGHVTNPRCADGPEKMRTLLSGLSHTSTDTGAAKQRPWFNGYVQRTLQLPNVAGDVDFSLSTVTPKEIAQPFGEICTDIADWGKTHRVDASFFTRVLGAEPRRSSGDAFDDTAAVVAHINRNLEKIVVWINANAE